MKILHLTLTSLYLFAFSWLSTLAFVQKRYEIHDLNSNDPAVFAQDAAQWMIPSTMRTPVTSRCSGQYMMLGPGVLDHTAWIKRRYTNLREHQRISARIQLWLMSEWHSNDYLHLIISNAVQTFMLVQIATTEFQATWSTGTCTSPSYSAPMLPVTYFFSLPHNGDELIIQLINTNPNILDRVYYAIRDIKILTSTTPWPSGRLSYGCGVSNPMGLLLTASDWINNCGCPVKQYWDGTSCANCQASSGGCKFSNTDQDTFICETNYVYNGETCEICHATCETCKTVEQTACISCYPGNYLYRNSTCLPSCHFPFAVSVADDVDYCNFPCSINEYYYANTSCLASCPFPFVIRAHGDDKYCDFPCDSLTSYVYPDHSCRNSCDPPMIDKIEDTYALCLPPCEDDMFYYTQEMACAPNCLYPNRTEQKEFYSTCYYIKSEPIALMSGTLSEVVNKGVLASSCVFVGHSWGIFVASITRMFQHVRYLNISFATHAEIMTETWNSSILTLQFAPVIPENLRAQVKLKEVRKSFEIYNIHSSFFVNFWRGFISIAIVFLITFVLRAIEWIIVKTEMGTTACSVSRYLRISAQNFFIIMLYGNYGDAVLFAVIDFKSLSFDSTLDDISFLLAFGFLLLIFCTICMHIWFLVRRQKLIDEGNITNLERFDQKYAGSQVIFRDFKYECQIFLLYFLIRDVVFNIVVATLMDYPLYQAGIMFILSFGVVLYLLSVRPFKQIYDQLQILFCELLLLATNGLALFVSILDDLENTEDDLRVFMGKTILTIYMIFYIAQLTSFGLKALSIVYEFYRSRNPKPKESIKHTKDQSFHISDDHLGTMGNRSVTRQNLFDSTDMGIRPNFTEDNMLVSLNTENAADEKSGNTRRNKIKKLNKGNTNKPAIASEGWNQNNKIRVHVGQLKRGEQIGYREHETGKKSKQKAPLTGDDRKMFPQRQKKNKRNESEQDLQFSSFRTGSRSSGVDFRCKEKDAILKEGSFAE